MRYLFYYKRFVLGLLLVTALLSVMTLFGENGFLNKAIGISLSIDILILYYSLLYSSLQLLSRLLIAPSQCLQSLEQCA